MISSTWRRVCWRALSIAFGVLVVLSNEVQAGFTAISQPDASYLANTTLAQISAADFDAVASLSFGTHSVSFNADLVALTVPTTWSSWGAPPNVESSTPRVLWTNGFTSLTLSIGGPVNEFGFEAQPNTSVVSSMLASFYQGASLVGEIPLDVDGNGGARLFAATSTDKFNRIVVSSTDDFAIAEIRSGSVPEPAGLTLLTLGAAAVAFAGIRARRRKSGPTFG
jgi:hypothetical protein